MAFKTKISIVWLLSLIISKSIGSFVDQVERRDAENRVIGGTNADPVDYPWFASLGGGGCGGSLVAPEFILTAAHCLSDNIYQKATIGKYCSKFGNCGIEHERIAVRNKVFVHPEYSRAPTSNDFMLLRLKERSAVTPIEMDFGSASDNYTSGRSGLWTAGFGFTNFQKKIKPDILKHLELNYADNEVCNLAFSDDDWTIQDNMICGQNDDPSKQACFGDSGGPLYDKVDNKLVGVTSWGDNNCESKLVVYARIASQIDWITSTICENHSFPKPSFCSSTVEPSNAPSISSQPSMSSIPSPVPSKTVSDQPSATSMPSSSPTKSTSPSSSSPPQTIYFQIVANNTSFPHNNFCIEIGSSITLQKCEHDNTKQLWRADSAGQLRSYHDEDYCITPVQRDSSTRENLQMRSCEEVGNALNAIFIYNSFQSSLLWIKSNVDWQRWGLRSFSVETVMNDAFVTLEKHDYGDFSNRFVQKWIIEYPPTINQV